MMHRALISRDADAQHEALRNVTGIVASEPHVGDPLQFYLDTGKIMRTTAVKRIADKNGELVVETANSRYRLKLSPLKQSS